MRTRPIGKRSAWSRDCVATLALFATIFVSGNHKAGNLSNAGHTRSLNCSKCGAYQDTHDRPAVHYPWTVESDRVVAMRFFLFVDWQRRTALHTFCSERKGHFDRQFHDSPRRPTRDAGSERNQ